MEANSVASNLLLIKNIRSIIVARWTVFIKLHSRSLLVLVLFPYPLAFTSIFCNGCILTVLFSWIHQIWIRLSKYFWYTPIPKHTFIGSYHCAWYYLLQHVKTIDFFFFSFLPFYLFYISLSLGVRWRELEVVVNFFDRASRLCALFLNISFFLVYSFF